MSTKGYRSAWQSLPNNQKRQDDLTRATHNRLSQGQSM